ncbi:sigma-70 family RNA polymerase sigma factor [Nonomuraea jabiensis]|uniref:sigma-70 family RNA polymerase sigma factor n=1 Tax=Nonomuraea jabiensis TaxID=882448 RepID=UPI00342F5BDC
MDEHEFLAGRFEEHRTRLAAVAYRMLGSHSEAEDAVQEAWLRLSRSDAGEVENLGGWLTTVVGRICLDLLRRRAARHEEPLGARLPDPVVGPAEGADPEQEALLADSVGLALLVVLESLTPAERLAFVLHDLFSVPFEEIGPIMGRTTDAAKQLASRARRRVRGSAPGPGSDLTRQREVVDAFLAAARDGDFEALLAVLDPDVTARSDLRGRGALTVVRGAAAVARQAIGWARLAGSAWPALVNGSAGFVALRDGRPFAIMGFAIVEGRVARIDVLADPERVARADLSGLG